MSAAAFFAWRYIRRSDQKVQEIREKAGTVEILPPEEPDTAQVSSAAEIGKTSRTAPELSAAAEDLSRR